MKRIQNKSRLLLIAGITSFVVMLVSLLYCNVYVSENHGISNVFIKSYSYFSVVQQEQNNSEECNETVDSAVNINCTIESITTAQVCDNDLTESACEDVLISTTDNEITEEYMVESTTEYYESTEMIQTTQVIEEVTTTEHVHTYAMSSSCAYYPEEGHYEKVCVSEGYTEEIYECYDKYCYYCGAIMDDWDFEALLEHSSIHGAYGTQQIVVETIWHEPIYEEIWVVDKEEYYEEEVVVECIECGYIE